MTPIVKLAILLLLALLAARVSGRLKGAGLGVSLLLAVGTHLLAFGVLIGPVAGLLSRDALSALAPFLALGLGWTGMLIGAQLDRQQLRLFSARLALATLVQGGLAFAVALGSGWLIHRLMAGASAAWGPTRPAVLILAAVTAVSAPAAIGVVSHGARLRGPVTRLLSYMSSLDGLIGLLVVAVVFAYHRPPTGSVPGIGSSAYWLLVSLLTGVLVGGVFVSLTRSKPSPDELVLYLGGTVLFGSGIAYALRLSPLVVCLVAGVVVANLSRVGRRAYAMLAAWERPIYGLFLILAGAMLRPPGWMVVPLVAVLLVVRLGAKGLGAWAAIRLTAAGRVPRRAGLGLYAHGGLTLAIVIGYALNYGPSEPAVADMVFTGVVLAAAVSDLVGPFLLRDVLARAGEFAPRPSGPLGAAAPS